MEDGEPAPSCTRVPVAADPPRGNVGAAIGRVLSAYAARDDIGLAEALQDALAALRRARGGRP